ncbi:DoxX family protein [Lyngbya confervoides]|uniref:DoxX family protein n=1 Tax=Lyngbya confervoides BDU141951 TaxID=1574623 RepID=A0ABD4T3N4_9CYAN|nr:DoxX family protein [Lyngbya confervoides]MCM1983137.1 DoxX family protein [Lyngbya confervoides BDU141951]
MTSTQAPSSLLTTLLRPAVTDNTGFQLTTLVVRVLVGALMIHNGLDKLSDVSGFAENVVAFIGLPFPVFLTYCAAYIEIISSTLLALGLLTRLNGLALLSTMLVAIFFHLKSDGFQVPPLETASLYALIFLFFTIYGAGRFSGDALLTRSPSDS